MDSNTVDAKVSFEEALEKTGYGMYNYLMIAMTGLATLSFSAMAYGSTIIVPASACELQTTTAQQGLLVAVPVFGAVVGTLLWGFLGDTRGRRGMLLVSLLLAAASNAFASLSVNWIMLMVVQLLTVTLGSGIYVLSMTLLSESVPPRKRNVAMLLVSSMFLLGQGIISVMAIPIIPLTFSRYLPTLGIYWNSWRTLLVVYSLPNLVCATFLLFVQESPKYALAVGDEDRAVRILRSIYMINNNGSRAEELQVTSLLRETGSDKKKLAAKDQFVPLFKKPHVRNTLIMTCLFILIQITVAFAVWAPTISNQFMQLLSSGEGSDLTLCQIIAIEVNQPDTALCSIDANALLLMFGACSVHAIFNTIVSQIVDKVGRRNMAMIITSVCGAGGVLVNLVPNAFGSVSLFIFFTTGLVALGFYTTIAISLFPTHLRTMAVATTMIGGRVASIFLIQIVNYLLVNSCALGFYIFCTLFALSAPVLALLPDDRNLHASPKDPERLEDQHGMTSS